ncbi:MAG TPA: DUF169 domain-containing protein [Candidatus Acidoferrales bacterium]|jgi:uncharacterized protein (DUF169 family)|nr:DUF169 domain-containing protein [Candidatus Acidoferrales bacterium]
MTNWNEFEEQFTDCLALDRRPVAVTFLDSIPSNVPKFSGTEPAGCSYWRLAAAGRTFYTVPADHFNCAVGAYTHNVQLPPDRVQETEATLGMMFNIGYVRPEEVPGIPRLAKEPVAVVFAPLGDTPVDPSVVLFSCKTSAAMLLNEASLRAGASSSLPLLGRPSCMALPAALAYGTVTTLGCIGNRVYTDLSADELYIAVPGAKISAVSDALGIISTANATLEEYARGRQAALSTV